MNIFIKEVCKAAAAGAGAAAAKEAVKQTADYIKEQNSSDSSDEK